MRTAIACLLSLLIPACTERRGGEAEGADMADGADMAVGGDMAVVNLPPIAFLEVDTMYQNCQPPVHSDPLLLNGRMTIRSQSNIPLGPLSATEGILVDRNDNRLATFLLYNLETERIGPFGAVENKRFDKLANSLMPQNGCMTIPCGESVRVEIPLSGKNLVEDSKAKSAPYVVSCVR